MSGSEPAKARTAGGALDIAALETPVAVVARLAKETPDKAALVLGDRVTSYRALNDSAARFVAYLAENGLKPGDHVAYLGKNSAAFAIAMLGCMRAGVILVPINWRCAAPEVRFMLDDCDAALLILDEAFVSLAEEADTRARRRLVIGGPGPDGFEKSIADASLAGSAERSGLDDAAACLRLYTSGTTGKPKGVLVSQAAIAAARQMERQCGGFDDWTAAEVLLSPLPLFHIGGISWMVCGFYHGASVVLANDLAPASLLDLCLAHGVSRTFMVPTLVRGLIEEMVSRDVRAPSLKAIHYGAAPMDAPLLERALETIGCRFLQYFGMTEMAGTITILNPDDHDLKRPHLLRSVGRVLPGCAIEIRGPDGAVLNVGDAGEIYVMSPTRMIEYAGRPDAMADAFSGEWYRTGDGGRIDDEDFLYLTDRIKDMVVTGGENVYPAEVEAVLREHPAVGDCAVFGAPDPKWGEAVTAAIELRAGASVTADELIDFCRSALAGYKIPRRYEIGAVLARTASGKVQRRKVRGAFLGEDEAAP